VKPVRPGTGVIGHGTAATASRRTLAAHGTDIKSLGATIEGGRADHRRSKAGPGACDTEPGEE